MALETLLISHRHLTLTYFSDFSARIATLNRVRAIPHSVHMNTYVFSCADQANYESRISF